ncbi:hypothetical protein RFI_28522 [Reticulomyxa filosa]|uniref:DNA-dependent protein kinase catalytic subunit CC1/2 domain-containing protein n=1 Tax=Reticulomyxa filosa TaxID=46433 RepID=X6M4H9_RETFI|nr:hypothetical protein RFI_28522 [Reticulomyxa filosa]|eukprot:ETO08868.1 hypothetical protein RFI_28522 [Reticulomyxa filosa]
MLLVESLSVVANPPNQRACAGSISSWFEAVLQQNKEGYIVQVFEGGREFDRNNTKSTLSNPPNFSETKTGDGTTLERQLRLYCHWMENLSTSLDCYYWLICKNVLGDIRVVYKVFENEYWRAHIIKACKHFLDHLHLLRKACLTSDQYLKAKAGKLLCEVNSRLFRFTEMIMKHSLIRISKEILTNTLLYTSLLDSLCVPEATGFLDEDPLRIKQLQQSLGAILRSLTKQDTIRGYLVKILKKYLNGLLSTPKDKNNKGLGLVPSTWTTTNFFKVPGQSVLLLKGLQIIAKTSGLLSEALDTSYVFSFL